MVSIQVDGEIDSVTIAEGSSVQQALEMENITLSSIDRVTPPPYTLISNNLLIIITRIREEFETQQIILPYSRQELRNESLTSGEIRLIQAGQNGIEEITIRHIFENDVESGSSVVSEKILQEPVSEIVMIGVQSPYSPITIPGKLAYLTGGNAWIMDGSTSNRWPAITSGDLDGHIFNLSPDGNWLLFTRKPSDEESDEINSLWVISTSRQSSSPIALGVSNVIHFADWQPNQTYSIAYSTVEPSSTAPGWDANNDLHFIKFSGGKPGEDREILDTNYGGIYPWWGMNFCWSPDGEQLAFSRPDGIGIVDVNTANLNILKAITPLNTHGDWAWNSNIAWGLNNEMLYFTDHAEPTGLISPEDSPNFNLSSIAIDSSSEDLLASQTGMFAYPSPSPIRNSQGVTTQFLAYMQAIFPNQSALSRYKLIVSEMDGSNPKTLFPIEGQSGLEPQKPTWAPESMENGNIYLAVIYDGNLWILDAQTGFSQQVTGDGLTKSIDWK